MGRDIGGTGFVSLSDYLGANQGVLDAGYNQDATAAHNVGDTFNKYLGLVQPSAQKLAAASGTAAPTGSVEGYNSAIDEGLQAKEMARKFGSQAGLAGAGASPTSGAASFNAALEYGAHGGDYRSLSGYLGDFSPASVDDAYERGTTAGIGQYRPPGPPPPPPGPTPNPNNAGGPGPGGGSERAKERPNPTPWPWVYPADTGMPKRKGPGGH